MFQKVFMKSILEAFLGVILEVLKKSHEFLAEVLKKSKNIDPPVPKDISFVCCLLPTFFLIINFGVANDGLEKGLGSKVGCLS